MPKKGNVRRLTKKQQIEMNKYGKLLTNQERKEEKMAQAAVDNLGSMRKLKDASISQQRDQNARIDYIKTLKQSAAKDCQKQLYEKISQLTHFLYTANKMAYHVVFTELLNKQFQDITLDKDKKNQIDEILENIIIYHQEQYKQQKKNLKMHDSVEDYIKELDEISMQFMTEADVKKYRIDLYNKTLAPGLHMRFAIIMYRMQGINFHEYLDSIESALSEDYSELKGYSKKFAEDQIAKIMSDIKKCNSIEELNEKYDFFRAIMPNEHQMRKLFLQCYGLELSEKEQQEMQKREPKQQPIWTAILDMKKISTLLFIQDNLGIKENFEQYLSYSQNITADQMLSTLEKAIACGLCTYQQPHSSP